MFRMETKRCSKCGETRPISDFSPRPERPCGVRSSCKPCVRRATAEYRARNPEKEREYRANNRQASRERTARYRARHYERLRAKENESRRTPEFRASERERYERNKEHIAERRRLNRLRNLERVRERERLRRDKNRDAERAKVRRHYAKCRATSPKFRLENTIRSGIHAEIRRGSKRGRKTFDLLGYTSVELMAHLERQFVKGMSWDNYGEWHIDHIVPLASFNYSTPDEPDFRAAWALTNLRPLWAMDNFSKGAKSLLLT